MKTQSVTLSLPPELAEFVKQDMGFGAFSSVNEYLRELVRQRRQARIEADVKLLESAIAGAPDEEPSQEFFTQVSAAQKRLRAAKVRHA